MTTSSRSLEETYRDLLVGYRGEDTSRIVAALDRTLAPTYVAVPPPAVVATIQRLTAERRQHPRQATFVRRFNPARWLPRRLGVLPVVLALLVIVAIPVAAYQSISMIQRVLNTDGGMRHVVANKLGQTLNLSQTIAGYTVTLQWAYADTNRVVVAYAVQQPDGQPLERRVLSDSSLSDDAGHTLTFLGGPENEAGGAYVESFDAAGVASRDGQLRLHLAIPLFTALRQRDIANLQATPVVVPHTDSRQFVFDFTVPDASRALVGGQAGSREVNVGQTVTVAGQSVTLERVALSPSETRLYLRGAAINTTQFMPVLTAADWNSEQPSTWTPGVNGDARSWRTADGQFVVSYLASLTSKHGEWSLVVNPRELLAGATPIPSGGPWVFHFHIP